MDGSQPNPFSKLKPEDLASKGQMAQNHVDTQTMYEMLPNDLPEDEFEEEVEREELTFESFDGVERKLFVFRKKGLEGPLPAVVYTASAVTILDTANKVRHFQPPPFFSLLNLTTDGAWDSFRSTSAGAPP